FEENFKSGYSLCYSANSFLNLPLLSNLTPKSLLRFPISRYLELALQKYNLFLNCQMFFDKILNRLKTALFSYFLNPDLPSTSLPGLSIWDCKDTHLSPPSKNIDVNIY